MILFFHFICIWAHYVVSNILRSLKKDKVLYRDKYEGDSIDTELPQQLIFKNRNTKFALYEDETLKFSPPVYIQRYQTVAFILQDYASKHNVKKVIDFGCAKLDFFMYLKNIPGVTEILEVDIDFKALEKYSFKAAPLIFDHLMGIRSNALDVYVLAGSIADYDDHLINCDVVIAIELIEHLTVEDFIKMPFVVFHEIKPKLAIFTTPNADFNSLFPNFTNLRHEDHKFEWTRKEFFNWTQEILRLYPEYLVKFYGIGIGPEGSEHLGCCSQMAVFQRSESTDLFLTAREKTEEIHTYKLIEHYKYPFYVDPRTIEEKIIHEVQYQIPYLSSLETFYNYDINESEIPLNILKEYLSDLCPDDEKLLNILKNNGMIIRKKNNSWFLVLTDVDSDLSEFSFEYDDWAIEGVLENFCDNDDDFFREKWSDETISLHLKNSAESPSARSLKELKSKFTETEDFFCKVQDSFILTKNRKKFISLSCSELANFSKLHTSYEIKQTNSIKSKIEFKKNNPDRNSLEHVRENSQSFKKISKSYSLDSCIGNINFKAFEQKSYLDFTPRGSLSFHNDISFSTSQEKYMTNYSGSSLLSVSLDKASDSGYPFSFSLSNEDLTPEQLNNLNRENEVIS